MAFCYILGFSWIVASVVLAVPVYLLSLLYFADFTAANKTTKCVNLVHYGEFTEDNQQIQFLLKPDTLSYYQLNYVVGRVVHSNYEKKNKSYYANTNICCLIIFHWLYGICFLNEGLDNPRQEFCGADFQNFEREVSVALI